MGLAWQQAPLSENPAGRFLLEQPLPAHILYAEPAGRRMRVGLVGAVVAQGDDMGGGERHRPQPGRMKLLSVNAGTPQTVEWNGREVTTAIFKHPVEGPRFVGRINVEGDGQADRVAHGGEHRAVFVYQIESYHYWQEHLGRDDFTYGQFGENFTVQGLADNAVCVGDRYRIGTAGSGR